MSTINLENAEAFALNLAREAGNLLMGYFGKEGLDVEHKGRIDLVTEADLACEKLVTEAIKKAYPDHAVLSEEGTEKETASDYQWVIDPVDGTTNFAHGFPLFAVSIGLCHKGRPVAGVVLDPTRNEAFHAARGKGAFLNQKPIRVSSAQQLDQALLATGFPYDVRTNPKNNLDNFNTMIMHCQAIRRPGAAAIDLCYTACGRLDGFWEQRLKPWDMAAGALIVEEAGGKITNMDGTDPMDLFEETCLAANPTIHRQMLEHLNRRQL